MLTIIQENSSVLCEQQSKFIYFMNNRTIITHNGGDWRLLFCIPLARCSWSKIGCKSLHNWLHIRHTVSIGYAGQQLVPSAHFSRLLVIASGLAIFSVSGKDKNCLCKVAFFLCKEVYWQSHSLQQKASQTSQTSSPDHIMACFLYFLQHFKEWITSS